MLQGPGPDIDLAEDACVSLEMVLDSMDEGLKQEAQRMVGEFKRLQRVEREEPAHEHPPSVQGDPATVDSGIRIFEGGLVPDPGVLPGSAAAEVSDCNGRRAP